MVQPPQNIYDAPEFFAGYSELRRARIGFNEGLEHPATSSINWQSDDL